MLRGKLDGKFTGRALAAGLAFVLVFLTSFAVWAAYTTNQASQQAMALSTLSSTYTSALDAARREKAAVERYERSGSKESLSEYTDAVNSLTTTLHSIANGGLEQDQAMSKTLGSTHLQYLGLVNTMFKAVRQGEHGPGVEAVESLSDGAFERFENQLQTAARDRNYEAQASLTSLRRTEISVLIGTPIAFAIGLVLLGIFSALLLRSTREAKEAQKREMSRLQESAQRLQALDDMKNAFLQAVSHELRTPLTSILGFALTLERADEGLLNLSKDEHAEVVARLASNARRLQELLSELLDLDRMARGILKPHRQPVDVSILVKDMVEMADLSGRRVKVDARSVVIAVDGPKVERIVENLLNNALKYTPTEATITVTVEPFEEGVLVAVDDGGPGVPDGLKEEIFEPFRQGPNRSLHSPGTGIGLSLVARFTELHGGRAWVEDRPNGGSSFRVYLPDAPATEVESAEQELTALSQVSGSYEPSTNGASETNDKAASEPVAVEHGSTAS